MADQSDSYLNVANADMAAQLAAAQTAKANEARTTQSQNFTPANVKFTTNPNAILPRSSKKGK